MKTIRVQDTEGRRGVRRFVRRQLLRLFAPAWARVRWNKTGLRNRGVRLCDMDDGHLINTVKMLRRRQNIASRHKEMLPLLNREAGRRGVNTYGPIPKWLELENAAYRKRRAEALMREVYELAAPYYGGY